MPPRSRSSWERCSRWRSERRQTRRFRERTPAVNRRATKRTNGAGPRWRSWSAVPRPRPAHRCRDPPRRRCAGHPVTTRDSSVPPRSARPRRWGRRDQHLRGPTERRNQVDRAASLEAEAGPVRRPARPVLIARQTLGHGDRSPPRELTHVDPKLATRARGVREELAIGRQRRMNLQSRLGGDPADPADANGGRRRGAE